MILLEERLTAIEARLETLEKRMGSKKFNPPTIDEVAAYIRESGFKVDAKNWHDFYSAKGWMIGKNKMKDWKAAVRTWNRSSDTKGNNGKFRRDTEYKQTDPNAIVL